MAEAGFERDDLAGNLGCSRQGEAPAPRAQCPLNRREGADLRLPGGAIGVAALHLQQLACHRYAPALLFFSSAGSVSPEVVSGSAGVTSFRDTASRNPLNRSMGIGKNVVELFSEEISVTVCR